MAKTRADSPKDDASVVPEDQGGQAPVILPGEGTPGGDTLRAAHVAFGVGNYAQVRSLTAQLLNHTDPAIARNAFDLRRRTQVDPAQIVVLLLCLGFFSWVVWKYVLS